MTSDMASAKPPQGVPVESVGAGARVAVPMGSFEMTYVRHGQPKPEKGTERIITYRDPDCRRKPWFAVKQRWYYSGGEWGSERWNHVTGERAKSAEKALDRLHARLEKEAAERRQKARGQALAKRMADARAEQREDVYRTTLQVHSATREQTAEGHHSDAQEAAISEPTPKDLANPSDPKEEK